MTEFEREQTANSLSFARKSVSVNVSKKNLWANAYFFSLFCLFVCLLFTERKPYDNHLITFVFLVRFLNQESSFTYTLSPFIYGPCAKKMRSPNSTNMSPVFPFGICFHRKVSAKAWNGISFFNRNVLTNEISFLNIPAAVPVLLDMVERPDKTCSIYFSTGFSENLSTWKTTTTHSDSGETHYRKARTPIKNQLVVKKKE